MEKILNYTKGETVEQCFSGTGYIVQFCMMIWDYYVMMMMMIDDGNLKIARSWQEDKPCNPSLH